jgi:hypothetical protein
VLLLSWNELLVALLAAADGPALDWPPSLGSMGESVRSVYDMIIQYI